MLKKATLFETKETMKNKISSAVSTTHKEDFHPRDMEGKRRTQYNIYIYMCVCVCFKKKRASSYRCGLLFFSSHSFLSSFFVVVYVVVDLSRILLIRSPMTMTDGCRVKCFRVFPKRGALPFVENPVPNFFFFFFFWSDVGFRVFKKKKDRERIFWGERERERETEREKIFGKEQEKRERERGEKRKGVFESYCIVLVIIHRHNLQRRKRVCRRERETDGEKERDVLLGARPDWVCRGGRRLGVAPARDARGGKPRGVWIARRRHSFGRGGKRRFQTVGTLYYYVGVCVFERYSFLCVVLRRTTTTTTTTPLCVFQRSLSSRLVEYHHHHHHHLCVCERERESSDETARLASDRQTERARRCFLAVRAHLFFFLLTQTRIVFGRDGEEPKTYIFRWREDERVI